MHKYTFKFSYTFYILTKQELTDEQYTELKEILKNFPHANRSHESIETFNKADFSNFDEKLLRLAANAYDHYGNTVLGVVCENGYSVKAAQKLIDLGAELNTPDDNMSKLPLHWAINNKVTVNSDKKNTYAAIAVLECLLKSGADTSIVCYRGSDVLEYAQSRGFTLAAKLLEYYQETHDAKLAMIRLLYNGLFSTNIYISSVSFEPMLDFMAKQITRDNNDILSQFHAIDMKINATKAYKDRTPSKELYLYTKSLLNSKKYNAQDKGAIFNLYGHLWHNRCQLGLEDLGLNDKYNRMSFWDTGTYNKYVPMTEGFDLSGACLAGIELDNFIFLGVNFEGANVSQSELSGSQFVNCNLSNLITDNKGGFGRSRFRHCNLENSDLSYTNLYRAMFDYCNISNTKIQSNQVTFSRDYRVSDSCFGDPNMPSFTKLYGLFSRYHIKQSRISLSNVANAFWLASQNGGNMQKEKKQFQLFAQKKQLDFGIEEINSTIKKNYSM